MNDDQGKNFSNVSNIESVSFDEKTIKTKLELWLSLFTQPMKVIDTVANNTKIDLMQIILITIAATLIAIITRGGHGFGSIISTPIGIALGGVFLLIITLIAKGSTDYTKLVNFSAYLVLITSAAGIFAKVPIVSFIASISASVYCVYLQYIGIPHITGGKKETVKIICIIELAFLGIALIVSVLAVLGFVFFSFAKGLGR